MNTTYFQFWFYIVYKFVQFYDPTKYLFDPF